MPDRRLRFPSKPEVDDPAQDRPGPADIRWHEWRRWRPGGGRLRARRPATARAGAGGGGGRPAPPDGRDLGGRATRDGTPPAGGSACSGIGRGRPGTMHFGSAIRVTSRQMSFLHPAQQSQGVSNPKNAKSMCHSLFAIRTFIFIRILYWGIENYMSLHPTFQ